MEQVGDVGDIGMPGFLWIKKGLRRWVWQKGSGRGMAMAAVGPAARLNIRDYFRGPHLGGVKTFLHV